MLHYRSSSSLVADLTLTTSKALISKVFTEFSSKTLQRWRALAGSNRHTSHQLLLRQRRPHYRQGGQNIPRQQDTNTTTMHQQRNQLTSDLACRHSLQCRRKTHTRRTRISRRSPIHGWQMHILRNSIPRTSPELEALTAVEVVVGEGSKAGRSHNPLINRGRQRIFQDVNRGFLCTQSIPDGLLIIQ